MEKTVNFFKNGSPALIKDPADFDNKIYVVMPMKG